MKANRKKYSKSVTHENYICDVCKKTCIGRVVDEEM